MTSSSETRPPKFKWQIRPYRDDDIPAIVAVINAMDAADQLDEGRGEDEISSRFHDPNADPYRLAFVVEGPRIEGMPEGMLLGAAALQVEADSEQGLRSYIARFWSHPAARQHGLEPILLGRLIALAREHEASSSISPMQSTLFAGFRDNKLGRRELYERFGLRPTREFWRMACPLDLPIKVPHPIPGVTLRTYRRPEDNAAACAAYNDSFRDHWDHHDETLEGWNHAIAAPSRRPDLSWIAEINARSGHVAGFCLCAIHEEDIQHTGRKEGWIELLGTTREWRSKGLGKSLLLHGLHSLKSAGLDIALLGVDSTSPTGAQNLYTSTGFTIHHRDAIYSSPLDNLQ
ncbi:MAG: GNAT family N-acetyltransferase [Chloroflexia bacterium]